MKELKIVIVTLVVVVLAGALGFVAWTVKDPTEVKDLKNKIEIYGVLKVEQQLELDILRIQKEIAILRGPARNPSSPAVTPQQLGGEFVPMDQLPPEVQKRAATEK